MTDVKDRPVNQQYIGHAAWMLGFQDHIKGRRRDTNPFAARTGSIDYQAWDQGWCTAEEERNHAVSEVSG